MNKLNTFENATGIVVDDQRLQIVSVSKGLREVKLKGAATIDNYAEMTPDELSEAVKAKMSEAGISTESIILGIPRDQLIVRNVELPLEVEENLDQVVHFQVEKFEPVEGEASFHDYCVVSRDETRNKIELQIFLAPPQTVEEPLALLEELGLTPLAARISGHSLGHLLHLHPDGFPQDDPSLIIEARPDRVVFNLCAGPSDFQSGQFRPAGDKIETRQVLAELSRFLSNIDLPGDGLSRIYFCGSEAPALMEEMGADLEGCELLFDRLELKTGAVTRSGLEDMADALGLALSGLTRRGAFNLIPSERRLKRTRPSLVPSVVLGLVLLLTAGAVVARDYVQNERLLDQLRQEVATRRNGVDESLRMRNQIDERQAQIEQLRSMLTGNQSVLRVLRELTEQIPDNSYLESISMQNESLNITGHSEKASHLLTILNKSKCLENVETRFIIPGANNKEKFRFEAQVKDCPLDEE
ncbi:MAG TPA: PilN domain-containing protein [Acidobacteriota bacterium]|nr:PilN domain-containing protein [Acidobacteriota bacterium]